MANFIASAILTGSFAEETAVLRRMPSAPSSMANAASRGGAYASVHDDRDVGLLNNQG